MSTSNRPAIGSRSMENESTDAFRTFSEYGVPETRRGPIGDQLVLASSAPTLLCLLSAVETSYKMCATVRELCSALRNWLPIHEIPVRDNDEVVARGESSRIDNTGTTTSLSFISAPPAATIQSEDRSRLAQLDGFSATTTELLQNKISQDILAESARRVMGEALRDLLSLKTSVECALAVKPYVPSRAQTWMPLNLAQRVSRVYYYYSRGYIEEVTSGPLEVSGYTVTLTLACETKGREVVLSFRAQFCACAANEKVAWPFDGELELTIHHPTDAARNRTHRLRPSRDQETIMPRLANNAPVHLAGPIGASLLAEDGLWAMGTLHLSIKILL
ncbi:hypothetical protein HPB50_020682 [Hyalomma asiaticum]|uniref:Uncharacterized protein n=1 Tax=Hyalomma asiaticum TaxID=266040 RepID=A0ACB7SK30_HYAAI|nr:hypothetical protein HPB50_020682 [Hyalomma asiaticum]